MFSGSDIPIIHDLYETYKLWHALIIRFPKSERYTLGQACSVIFLSIVECTLSASYDKDKIAKVNQLKGASVKLDMLKLLVRLAKDCDCLQNKEYLELQSKIHRIGKMLGGWIKSLL